MGEENNQNIKVEYKNEDFPIYYSNGASVAPTYYDFQFNFTNQYVNGNQNDVFSQKNLCKIFMSPEHAKVFSMIISRNIAEYEKIFGEIKVPKEMVSDNGELK